MFISVSEAKGRFTFLVGEDPNDDPRAHFWSLSDAHLVLGLKQDYASFGEAHTCASKLVSKRPLHVMAKRVTFHKLSQDYFEQFMNAKDTSVSHFHELLDLVEERLNGIETLEDRERGKRAEAISKELAGIVGDINSLMQLADDDDMKSDLEDSLQRVKDIEGDKRLRRSLAKVAAMEQPEISEIAKDALVAFGEAAFLAIQPIHRGAFLNKIAFLEQQGVFEVSIAEKTEAGISDIVTLRFGEDLLLSDILPSFGTRAKAPLHSKKFYSNYWKPITTAIGHIAPPGYGVVAVPAKDHGARDAIPGFEVATGKQVCVSAVFSGDDKQFWKLSSGDVPQSKFTEGELVEGEEVKCINRTFPSYFGRTGTISAVAPRHDYADVTVDFRRGLGKVVMTDKDLERVVLP